jgi:hypothetical protein
MSKKEEFKLFAGKHPELVKYIKSGDASWQRFYEIYDIYGEDENAWKDYIGTNNDYNFKALTDKLKNIDINSIQEHITTAQKALGIVGELVGKGSPKVETEEVLPRPINKIFED